MKLGRGKQNQSISMISTKNLLQYKGLKKDGAKIAKELVKRGVKHET